MVSFGGARLVKSQLLHVNLEWHIAWALLFFLGLAIYLAIMGLTAKALSDADFYLQMSYFIFSVAAVIPYDFTSGLILIILFFCAIPFHAITRINIENATNKENDLDNIRGLWRTLRSEERIRTLLSFSLTPLLLSPTFYTSFLWADWAVAPFFRYGLWTFLALWSFIFTAALFRPVLLIFAGDTASHTAFAKTKRPGFTMALIALFVLLLASSGNLIALPVHRLKGMIQADYAPLLNWLGPEANAGYFMVSSYRYALDVLVK